MLSALSFSEGLEAESSRLFSLSAEGPFLVEIIWATPASDVMFSWSRATFETALQSASCPLSSALRAALCVYWLRFTHTLAQFRSRVSRFDSVPEVKPVLVYFSVHLGVSLVSYEKKEQVDFRFSAHCGFCSQC